jgi:hypothetical protein
VPYRRRAPIVVSVVAVLVVAATAAAVGTHPTSAQWSSSPAYSRPEPTCNPPALPGHAGDLTLYDIGAMMGSGWMRGMMRLTARPYAVPAGDVSLRAWNARSTVHELVVLPLGSAGVGARTIARRAG